MSTQKTAAIDAHKEEIIQRYENGESSVKIAKDLGFSSGAILKRLKDAGIHIRDESEKQRGDKNQQWKGGKSLIRTGKMFREKNHRWKGGRVLYHGKYYKILVEGKYIREDTLIMEKHLGRKLNKYEHVFHKDGNTLNSSLENLYTIDKTTNDEEVAKMNEMYKGGATLQKVADSFNVTPCTVLNRLRKYGYTTRGIIPAKPRRKIKDEYIKVRDNTGKQVMLHRLIMEQAIGRKLEDYEIVHHFNKNKQDNRIENLVLCSSNAEHIGRYHSIREKLELIKIRKEIFEEQRAIQEETLFLHRRIMEKHLKIRLTPQESVIHINGNKLDNSIENLIALRDHEKIKKMYEIYQSGCTVAQAGKQFGVSSEWVRRAFEFWGYLIRSKKEQMDLYWEERREKQKKFFEDIEKDEDFGQPL